MKTGYIYRNAKKTNPSVPNYLKKKVLPIALIIMLTTQIVQPFFVAAEDDGGTVVNNTEITEVVEETNNNENNGTENNENTTTNEEINTDVNSTEQTGTEETTEVENNNVNEEEVVNQDQSDIEEIKEIENNNVDEEIEEEVEIEEIVEESFDLPAMKLMGAPMLKAARLENNTYIVTSWDDLEALIEKGDYDGGNTSDTTLNIKIEGIIAANSTIEINGKIINLTGEDATIYGELNKTFDQMFLVTGANSQLNVDASVTFSGDRATYNGEVCGTKEVSADWRDTSQIYFTPAQPIDLTGVSTSYTKHNECLTMRPKGDSAVRVVASNSTLYVGPLGQENQQIYYDGSGNGLFRKGYASGARLVKLMRYYSDGPKFATELVEGQVYVIVADPPHSNQGYLYLKSTASGGVWTDVAPTDSTIEDYEFIYERGTHAVVSIKNGYFIFYDGSNDIELMSKGTPITSGCTVVPEPTLSLSKSSFVVTAQQGNGNNIVTSGGNNIYVLNLYSDGVVWLPGNTDTGEASSLQVGTNYALMSTSGKYLQAQASGSIWTSNFSTANQFGHMNTAWRYDGTTFINDATKQALYFDGSSIKVVPLKSAPVVAIGNSEKTVNIRANAPLDPWALPIYVTEPGKTDNGWYWKVSGGADVSSLQPNSFYALKTINDNDPNNVVTRYLIPNDNGGAYWDSATQADDGFGIGYHEEKGNIRNLWKYVVEDGKSLFRNVKTSQVIYFDGVSSIQVVKESSLSDLTKIVPETPEEDGCRLAGSPAYTTYAYNNDGKAYTHTNSDFDITDPEVEVQRGYFVTAKNGATVNVNGASFVDFKSNNIKNIAPLLIDGANFNMSSGSISNNWVSYQADDRQSGKQVTGSNAEGPGVKDYLKSVTLTPTKSAGGVIFTNNSKGTITGDASINNNRGDVGGILVQGQSEVLIGGEFDASVTNGRKVTNGGHIDNNVGFHYSGAVLVEDGATVRMLSSTSTLNNNVTWNRGGAVWATNYGTHGDGYGVTIDYNKKKVAEGSNKPWPNGDGKFIMLNGTIDNNMAFVRGGGINVESNQVHLLGGTISNNTCRALGGGIYVEGDFPSYTYTLTITDGYVGHNYSVRYWDLDESKPTVGGSWDNLTLTELNDRLDRKINLNTNESEITNATISKDKTSALNDSDIARYRNRTADVKDFPNPHEGAGGGVWLCPIGGTAIFSMSDNNEVIIDDNYASGFSRADDNATETRKGTDLYLHSGTGHMIITGLDKEDWYNEYTGKRVPDENGPVYSGPMYLINKTTNYETDIQTGIQIIDNISRDGGGIAANGTLMFGKPDDVYNFDTQIKFTKIWDKEIADKRKPVYFELFYKDPNGNLVPLDKQYNFSLNGGQTPGGDYEQTPETTENGGAQNDGSYKWTASLTIPSSVEIEDPSDRTKTISYPLFYLVHPITGEEINVTTKEGLKKLYEAVKGGQTSFNIKQDSWKIVIKEFDSEYNEIENVNMSNITSGTFSVIQQNVYVTEAGGLGNSVHGYYIDFTSGKFEQNATNLPEPTVEKYINKKTHQNLYQFDEVFEYEIMAFVPADATEIVLYDTLEEPLMFVDNDGDPQYNNDMSYNTATFNSSPNIASTWSMVANNKNGRNQLTYLNSNNHYTKDTNGSVVNSGTNIPVKDGMVKIGTMSNEVFTGATGQVEGDTIHVTINKDNYDGFDNLKGKWVRLTFDAAIKPTYRNIDKLNEYWTTNEDNKMGSPLPSKKEYIAPDGWTKLNGVYELVGKEYISKTFKGGNDFMLITESDGTKHYWYRNRDNAQDDNLNEWIEIKSWPFNTSNQNAQTEEKFNQRLNAGTEIVEFDGISEILSVTGKSEIQEAYENDNYIFVKDNKNNYFAQNKSSGVWFKLSTSSDPTIAQAQSAKDSATKLQLVGEYRYKTQDDALIGDLEEDLRISVVKAFEGNTNIYAKTEDNRYWGKLKQGDDTSWIEQTENNHFLNTLDDVINRVEGKISVQGGRLLNLSVPKDSNGKVIYNWPVLDGANPHSGVANEAFYLVNNGKYKSNVVTVDVIQPEKYVNNKVHEILRNGKGNEGAFDEWFEYTIMVHVPEDADEVIIYDTLRPDLMFVDYNGNTQYETFKIGTTNNGNIVTEDTLNPAFNPDHMMINAHTVTVDGVSKTINYLLYRDNNDHDGGGSGSVSQHSGDKIYELNDPINGNRGSYVRVGDLVTVGNEVKITTNNASGNSILIKIDKQTLNAVQNTNPIRGKWIQATFRAEIRPSRYDEIVNKLQKENEYVEDKTKSPSYNETTNLDPVEDAYLIKSYSNGYTTSLDSADKTDINNNAQREYYVSIDNNSWTRNIVDAADYNITTKQATPIGYLTRTYDPRVQSLVDQENVQVERAAYGNSNNGNIFVQDANNDYWYKDANSSQWVKVEHATGSPFPNKTQVEERLRGNGGTKFDAYTFEEFTSVKPGGTYGKNYVFAYADKNKVVANKPNNEYLVLYKADFDAIVNSKPGGNEGTDYKKVYKNKDWDETERWGEGYTGPENWEKVKDNGYITNVTKTNNNLNNDNSHSGLANNANYVVKIGNEYHSITTNTVTVVPKLRTLEITKKWIVREDYVLPSVEEFINNLEIWWEKVENETEDIADEHGKRTGNITSLYKDHIEVSYDEHTLTIVKAKEDNDYQWVELSDKTIWCKPKDTNLSGVGWFKASYISETTIPGTTDTVPAGNTLSLDSMGNISNTAGILDAIKALQPTRYYWTIKVKDLPVLRPSMKYFLKEKTLEGLDQPQYENPEDNTTEHAHDGGIIVNIQEEEDGKTHVSVAKVWDVGSETERSKARENQEIRLQLKADGDPVYLRNENGVVQYESDGTTPKVDPESFKTLNNDNNPTSWAYTWYNIPAYQMDNDGNKILDQNGKPIPINYTVEILYDPIGYMLSSEKNEIKNHHYTYTDNESNSLYKDSEGNGIQYGWLIKNSIGAFEEHVHLKPQTGTEGTDYKKAYILTDEEYSAYSYEIVNSKPQIEKYINKDVHYETYFGNTFTYDILVYVPEEAKEIEITDNVLETLVLKGFKEPVIGRQKKIDSYSSRGLQNGEITMAVHAVNDHTINGTVKSDTVAGTVKGQLTVEGNSFKIKLDNIHPWGAQYYVNPDGEYILLADGSYYQIDKTLTDPENEAEVNALKTTGQRRRDNNKYSLISQTITYVVDENGQYYKATKGNDVKYYLITEEVPAGYTKENDTKYTLHVESSTHNMVGGRYVQVSFVAGFNLNKEEELKEQIEKLNKNSTTNPDIDWDVITDYSDNADGNNKGWDDYITNQQLSKATNQYIPASKAVDAKVVELVQLLGSKGNIEKVVKTNKYYAAKLKNPEKYLICPIIAPSEKPETKDKWIEVIAGPKYYYLDGTPILETNFSINYDSQDNDSSNSFWLVTVKNNITNGTNLITSLSYIVPVTDEEYVFVKDSVDSTSGQYYLKDLAIKYAPSNRYDLNTIYRKVDWGRGDGDVIRNSSSEYGIGDHAGVVNTASYKVTYGNNITSTHKSNTVTVVPEIYQLPSSGGMGTFLFNILGAMFITLALTEFMSNGRKRKKSI